MAWEILFKMLMEAAPYIIGGFLVAGAIHQWVPKNLLTRHLGRKGQLPLLKAVGIGSLLPLCSCGTIPLGIGLFRCGASAGTVLSFMTSSPVLSPVVIMLSLKLLGIKLTVVLLASAAMGSYVVGWIGNQILSSKSLLNKCDQKQYESAPLAEGSAVRRWLHWSLIELGAGVSVDMIIGLGFATLLLSFISMEFVAAWLGQKEIATLFYVILIGIPVYACSVPSIPVVHSLLLLGATPGAAIAYMIAGPATNLGELNAIRRSMGTRTMVYYTAGLIATALVAGLIADQVLFADYQYAAAYVKGSLVVQQCCVPVIFNDTSGYTVRFSEISVLQWCTGTVLFVVITFGLIRKLRAFWVNPCCSCVWKEYAVENNCAEKCHVRRKHEFFIRLFR